MKLVFNNKKGFTLVELLIVISIIGILSVLAIGAYTEYRKLALLDLNADGIVSQFYQLRDNAIHGVGSVDDSAKCYGMRFVKGSDNYYAADLIAQDFTGQKSWNETTGQWDYQGCSGEIVSNGKPELETMMKIPEININSGSISNPVSGEFIVRFVPPDGTMDVFPFTGESITMKVQYGDTDQYSKVLTINLSSGDIEKQ